MGDGSGLSRQEAADLVTAWAQPALMLSGEAIATSYGWVFGVRVADDWLSSEGPLIGAPEYVAVECETGRLIPFADYLHHSVEPYGVMRQRVLDAFEAGYRHGWYDVTIVAVDDLAATVDGLSKLRLQYVVPERAGGRLWTIPRRYSETDLHHLLKDCPGTFTRQPLGSVAVLGVTSWFDSVGCCRYEIIGLVPDEANPLRRTGPAPAGVSPPAR